MPVAASQDQRGMYCSEQITIPLTFPSILKCYVKAAIRTQPYDLLRWTAAYFRALADGESPPVKKRLEYPPYDHPTGITPHFLKILLNQYGRDEENGKTIVERTATSMCVSLESLLARWRGLALSDSSLYQILMTGRLLELPGTPGVCDLYRFLAIACGLLGNNLFETMIHVCELLTQEPEGGSAMIPRKTFMNLYEYLADLDCSGGQSIIGSGPTGDATTLERDEASLVRSSSPSCDSSSVSVVASTDEHEARTVRCCSSDTSIDDTGSELSACKAEVPRCEKYSEQLATRDEDETAVPRCRVRAFEKRAGAETRTRRRSSSTRNGIGAKATDETVSTRGTRARNEKSTNDDKMRSAERAPEGTTVELCSGSGPEVTRVQEAPRRRRDVEMHSRTEEVKPVTGETTAELLDSPRSHPGFASLGESHVAAREGVKARDNGEAASDAPGENTKTQRRRDNLEETNKILDTRSRQLGEQVDGDRDPREQPPASGIGIKDASRGVDGTSTARRGRVKKIRKKNLGKFSATGRIDERNRKHVVAEKNTGDSSERDDSTDNGDKAARNERSSSAKSEIEFEVAIGLELHVELAKGDEAIGAAVNSVDDAGTERSYGVNESDEGCEYVEDEEIEDMAQYAPLGLENVLDGMCECLEPTRGVSSAAASSESLPPLDPVLEFVERMTSENPEEQHVSPEVAGIGPPVSNERITAVGLWLAECARRQQGYVGPRNLRHFLCPQLDETPPRCEDSDACANTCL